MDFYLNIWILLQNYSYLVKRAFTNYKEVTFLPSASVWLNYVLQFGKSASGAARSEPN